MYWINRNTGDIFRQDKFGRGVQVRIKRHVVSPGDIKIFQESKYNVSVENRCKNAGCSHLCLLIPKGHRCACPDGGVLQGASLSTCAAGKLTMT